jgi:hypothetical protein
MPKANIWGPACGQKCHAGVAFLPQAPLTAFFSIHLCFISIVQYWIVKGRKTVEKTG